MVFSLGTSASGPTSPCISESTRVRTTFGRPLRILQYRFLGSPVSCPSRITPLFLSDHYWTLRVAHIWAKRPSAPHPRNKRELFDLFRESSRENSFSHSTKTPSFIQQAFVEQTMSGSVLNDRGWAPCGTRGMTVSGRGGGGAGAGRMGWAHPGEALTPSCGIPPRPIFGCSEIGRLISPMNCCWAPSLWQGFKPQWIFIGHG